MKTLAVKFWTEPATFIAAIVAVLQVVQIAAVHDTVANAVIGAVLVALGGVTTRARVIPLADRH